MKRFYYFITRAALLSIFTAILTAVGLFYLRFDQVHIPKPYIFLISAVFFCVGIGVKQLFSVIIPSRSDSSRSILDHITEYGLPIITIAVLTLFFLKLPDAFFDFFRAEKIDLLKSYRSYYNFGITEHFFICAAVGVFIHREDPESTYSAYRAAVVEFSSVVMCFLINLVLHALEAWQMGSLIIMEDGLLVTYAVCFFTVAVSYAAFSAFSSVHSMRESCKNNEGHLEQTENRALLYTAVLLCVFLVIFLVLWTVVYLPINGLYALIRLILRPSDFMSVGAPSISVIIDYISIVFFFIILAVRPVFFIIGRNHIVGIRNLFKRIIEWVASVINIIHRAQRKKKHAEDIYIPEKEKHQDALINEYVFPVHTPAEGDTYAAFVKRLNNLPDNDRRIGYAYRTICTLYRSTGVQIKDSDTPREMVRKLDKASDNEKQTIVSLIERAKFGGEALTEEDKFEILQPLCEFVRREYM